MSDGLIVTTAAGIKKTVKNLPKIIFGYRPRRINQISQYQEYIKTTNFFKKNTALLFIGFG
jgi:hypothetical protein